MLYKMKNNLKKIAYAIFYPEYRIMYLVNKYIEGVNKKTRGAKIIRLLLRSILMTKYNLVIGLNSKIGKGIKMYHPMNIVIGDGSIIGNNCTIYQGVTLGQNKGGYPTIKNNVIIYPGAKIIGNITIGNNAIIGANAVVVKDVADNQIVAGVPARVVGENSNEQEFY